MEQMEKREYKEIRGKQEVSTERKGREYYEAEKQEEKENGTQKQKDIRVKKWEKIFDEGDKK